MKRTILTIIVALTIGIATKAQTSTVTALPKVYNEQIDPMLQIDSAIVVAKQSGKNVICQVGGNWCKWCLRFADFVRKDSTINSFVSEHYEFIHVNYPRGGAAKELMTRLHNAGRLGYPVFVVMDSNGNVIHLQDSSFLEQGDSYDPKKTLRFFQSWTPEAIKQ